MNKLAFTLLILVASVWFTISGQTLSTIQPTNNQQVQLHNRLPRKTIINAAQHALRDSTSLDQQCLCDKNTESISIEVSDRAIPYSILADSLGITLQLFCNDKCVYNDFIEYKGTNFAKIKAKANASKLKKVDLHNDSVAYAQTIVVKFNNPAETYCSLANNLGKIDYSGDLAGFVSYIESLIPNFSTIINSEYRDADLFRGNVAYLNLVKILPAQIDEEQGILCLPKNMVASTFKEDIGTRLIFEIELPYSDAQNLRLIKVKNFNDKKKKLDATGFTYETIVKESISPSLVKTTNNGIATIEFLSDGLSSGTYCIYNANSNIAYIFDLQEPRLTN